MAQAAQSTLLARIKGWFPDREFIMRSQGQVRFVRISSSLQMKAAGGAAALAVVWSATMGVAVVSEWNTRTNAAELSARAAKVATAESRVTAYREGLDEVADDLSRRQAFIEDMVEDHLGDMPGAGAVQGVQDSTAETRRTVQKVSAVLPCRQARRRCGEGDPHAGARSRDGRAAERPEQRDGRSLRGVRIGQ